MATQVACPACGATMREIVWGYGTLADVADAGDAVIGGCVVDVDPAGRVAALQCPACGTRADADGVALERPAPPATTAHLFGVAFSDPQPSEGVVSMDGARQRGTGEAHASPFADEDFGGIASGSDWRDHVEPYASRDDEVPARSAPAPERIEPYASREDALPERPTAAPGRLDPYASREDALPEGGGAWRDRIAPYAPDDDASPGMAEPAGEESPPGERID